MKFSILYSFPVLIAIFNLFVTTVHELLNSAYSNDHYICHMLCLAAIFFISMSTHTTLIDK